MPGFLNSIIHAKDGKSRRLQFINIFTMFFLLATFLTLVTLSYVISSSYINLRNDLSALAIDTRDNMTDEITVDSEFIQRLKRDHDKVEGEDSDGVIDDEELAGLATTLLAQQKSLIESNLKQELNYMQEVETSISKVNKQVDNVINEMILFGTIIIIVVIFMLGIATLTSSAFDSNIDIDIPQGVKITGISTGTLLLLATLYVALEFGTQVINAVE